MPKQLPADWRGTAQEIKQFAKQLIEDWHYQPDPLADVERNHEKAFRLLLQEIAEEEHATHWSLRSITEKTGVDATTVSHMRIALITLGILPYDDDIHSTQHIRDVWAALIDEQNEEEFYKTIAEENGWDITSTLYYARIGRFAGVVPSRNEPRTRPISDVHSVKAALLGDPKKIKDELTPKDYAKIAAIYPDIEQMLKASTDDDGYYETRSIKRIAKALDISPSIVKDVRIGLVVLGKLPEREPINRKGLKAAWELLQGDKETPLEELLEGYNRTLPAAQRLNKQALDRAGVIGRIAGEVTPRVLRKKSLLLPTAIELLYRGVKVPEIASRLGVKRGEVATWLRSAGHDQQAIIEHKMNLVLAIIIENPDLNNVQVRDKLQNDYHFKVSVNVIGDYIERLIEKLGTSQNATDITKGNTLAARKARRPADSREYPTKKGGPANGDG